MEPLETMEDCEMCRNRAERIGRRTCEEGKLLNQLSLLKRDGPWYVLPRKWHLQWKRFVLSLKVIPEKVTIPGQIDTSALLESNGKPKKGLVASRDYTVISQKLWEALEMLYGCGPAIRRINPDIYDAGVVGGEQESTALTEEQRAAVQAIKDIDLS